MLTILNSIRAKVKRIIAKLDVKPPNVVKPVHFEGLRKIGLPADLAEKYTNDGADEIAYIDIVASLYRRNILFQEVQKSSSKIFIPFAAGGGVNTVEDFSGLLHSGADKVIINTSALIQGPAIIEQASRIFGAQAVVVNIEAKQKNSTWECYTDCGRIQTGINVLEWVDKVQEYGAGEILLQSVDRDGRRRGFDIELIKKVVDAADIPVIAASGAGSELDVLEVIKEADPAAVAISSILHYEITTIKKLKQLLSKHGVQVCS